MYRDRGGTLVFSNAPAASAQRRFAPVDWFSPEDGRRGRRVYRASQKKDFDPAIHEFSRRYEVDPALVKAVIHAESNFVPYGEKWTCERCGRTWNTAQIPADEYRQFLRDIRRPRIWAAVVALVIAGALAIVALINSRGRHGAA